MSMEGAAERPNEMEIVSRYLSAAPVDVDGLAHDLGINVVRSDEVGPNVAGMIARDRRRGGPSGFVVTVNANDNRRRQRFTLAHEIGHFLLHRDLMDDGIVDDTMYRSPLGEWYERQADRSAGDCLLPANLVRAEYRTGNRSLSGLARTFDVSRKAMRIRLDQLGLGA
jgi:hypothetical protein